MRVFVFVKNNMQFLLGLLFAGVITYFISLFFYRRSLNNMKKEMKIVAAEFRDINQKTESGTYNPKQASAANSAIATAALSIVSGSNPAEAIRWYENELPSILEKFKEGEK